MLNIHPMLNKMLHTIMGPNCTTPFLFVAKYQINPLVKVFRHIIAFQCIFALLEKVLGTYQIRCNRKIKESSFFSLPFLLSICMYIKFLGQARGPYILMQFFFYHMKCKFFGEKSGKNHFHIKVSQILMFLHHRLIECF